MCLNCVQMFLFCGCMFYTNPMSCQNGGGWEPGGGTPYVMGDTYVPRFWPPFFTLAGSSTIFLGCFFSSTNTKAIFWVQILAKFDLFGPKIPFFPRSFWVQFSVARGTHPAIFGPSTPPGGGRGQANLLKLFLVSFKIFSNRSPFFGLLFTYERSAKVPLQGQTYSIAQRPMRVKLQFGHLDLSNVFFYVLYKPIENWDDYKESTITEDKNDLINMIRKKFLKLADDVKDTGSQVCICIIPL